MKLTVPDFYRRFECIADRCTDSCCVGWEIDIDADTYEKYRSLPKNFQSNISVSDGVAHFALGEDERCPLLEKNGLCKIILSYGEDMLCDICREHPRFYEWYGDFRDAGIGLCCEEAVRLLFESDEALQYETVETEETAQDGTPQEICNRMFALRKALFSDINDRNYALPERAKKCFEKLGTEDAVATSTAEEFYSECVEIMKELTPFDGVWSDYTQALGELSFESVKERFAVLALKEQIRYEKSLSYFAFRHFIKACFDGDALSHFKFAVMMTAFEILLDCVNGDLAFNTRYLSKQIEYSEENIDALTDECCFNARICGNNIVAFLKEMFNK